MQPQEYYTSIVVPNLEEFRRRKWGVREAFNSFSSAFHMHDHVFRSLPDSVPPKKIKDFRNGLSQKCHEFDIVSDVANSFKHLTLDKPRGAIQSLAQVDIHGLILLEDGSGYLALEDGMGAILQEDAEVCITLDNGSVVSAFDVVLALVHFWSTEFLH